MSRPTSPPLSTVLSAGALWLAVGCGAGAARAPAVLPGELVLERGGELRESEPERAIAVERGWVSVWGTTEVPDGARLQMALSGLDAITRAELAKAVRVRITSLITDVESSDPSKRAVMLETTESVALVLARTGPLPHGWVRVQRGAHVVLRLWARMRVRRAELEAALRAPLARTGHDAGEFVDRLSLTEGSPP